MPRNPRLKATRSVVLTNPKALLQELVETTQHLPADEMFELFFQTLRRADGDQMDRLRRLVEAQQLPVHEALTAVTNEFQANVLGYLVGCGFPGFEPVDADRVDKLLATLGIPTDHAMHPRRMRTGREGEGAHCTTRPEQVFQEAARAFERTKLPPRVYEEGGGKLTFSENFNVKQLPGGHYQLTRHFIVQPEGVLNEKLMEALRLQKSITQDKPQPLGTWRFEEKDELGEDGYPEFRIVATPLISRETDMLHGLKVFREKTEELRLRFLRMRSSYTQEDLRQSWMRWSDASESFVYSFGHRGGIRFVPKKYRKEMRAFYELLEFVYGSGTTNMRWWPVADTDEMRKHLKRDAEQDVQRRLDEVLADLDRKLKRLMPKLKENPKEFDEGLQRLKEEAGKHREFIEQVAMRYTDILGGKLKQFRIQVPGTSFEFESANQAGASDPRVRAFLNTVQKEVAGVKPKAPTVRARASSAAVLAARRAGRRV